MEDQLHPALAATAGVIQEQKVLDVHPSLHVEMLPDEQPEQVQEVVAQQEEPIQEAPKQVETQQDRDWRAVRARAEEAKQLAREKEALERERDFYRQQALERKKIAQAEDDYRTDTEKQLAQEMENLKHQVAQQAKETAEAKRKAAIWKAEADLARDYPDFNDVVSKENVERFEREYPHLFNASVSTSDVYATGSTAYELIIAKGIYKKPTNTLKQMVQNDVISRNLAKPRSASTISAQAGETPIKQANVYQSNFNSTEDERKALYAEMIAATRNKY